MVAEVLVVAVVLDADEAEVGLVEVMTEKVASEYQRKMVTEVLVVAVALDADGAEEAEAGLEEAGILKEEKVGAYAQSHVYTYTHSTCTQ